MTMQARVGAAVAGVALWLGAAGREMPVRVRFPKGPGEVVLEAAEAAAGASLEVLVDDGLRRVRQQWEQRFDLPPVGLLDQTFGVSRSGLPKQDGAKPIRLQRDGGEVELSLTVYDAALKTDGAEARTTLRAVPAADGTPAVIVHRLGSGTAVLLNAAIDPYRSLREKAEGGAERRLLAGLFAEAGLKPLVPVRPEGPWEIVRFADGDALYVCLLPDTPFPGDQTRPVRIQLPRRAFVYDVRARQALGQTDAVETTLAPGQPQIYALLPYDVRSITVEPAAEVAAGADLAVDVTLDLAPSQSRWGVCADAIPRHRCGRHCIRIELAGPDGRTVRHYAQNVITGKPAVRTTIPLAVNDPAGMWTIQATDVASGRASKATFSVSAAASDPLSNNGAGEGRAPAAPVSDEWTTRSFQSIPPPADHLRVAH